MVQDSVQNCVAPTKKESNDYLEGDFKGDGISEVLITNRINERYYYATTTDYTSIPNYENVYDEEYDYWSSQPIYHFRRTCEVKTVDDGKEFYWLNLDSNASTSLGSNGYVKLSNTSVLLGDKKIIADFNSDGKSDVLVINDNGTYKIVSFKQLKVSPWIELEVIGSGTIDIYSATKKLLLGDYNGDGKVDIMLPDTEGTGPGQTLWYIYYSNPNPAGGSFFVKESQNIVEYWPDTGGYYSTQRQWSDYYAIDINGDGKSDLVRVWRKYFKPPMTINDHDTKWWVTAFTNNIGKVSGSGFTLTYDSGTFLSLSPEVPISIASNYRYKGANTEVVIVFGQNNKIEYYQFNKNVDTDNRLKSVTESNGNITQTIDYLPMVAGNSYGGLGSPLSDFYSSANAALYPNIEIIRNFGSYLVSKLTATINGVSKYQDFRYFGYVSNFDYGTVGFTRTTRSSWYLSASDAKIWTTQFNDINLRGANTTTWTNTEGNNVFNAVPSNLLSTKTNVFDTYVNPDSKVYNVLLNKQTVLDGLTAVKSETTYTYDGTVTSANYYGLQTQSVSKQYSGTSLQGTTTIKTDYEDPIVTGNTYCIGRPKSTTTSTTVYTGDTRNSGETYTYSGSNLTKTEKTGHNTYALVEDMTYDLVGNLLTKTVSAPGATPAPATRTITDVYDASKRFVIKKTDHQGLATNFSYNSLGQVEKSTDYMGVVSNFTYDNWGKLLTTTIASATTVPIATALVYAKLSTGGYTVTSTNNLDAKTVTEYDVLGRVVKSSTKGFTANTMVTKQVVYDALGRKQKESEPYFSTPNLWTSYEYDYLMRPTKITAPTGKIQTLSYSGLTTTSSDDGKITTATVDALGNKVITTDPGGTINFKYFANGQMKESYYGGNKVTIEIDGWGNKIALSDPSAGNYSYSYDAFGQLKTETTPNGTTSINYDAAGRQTEKTIVGTNTNSKTVYAYNSVNQVTSSTFTDTNEAKIITTNYDYDTFKRLFRTTETTPYAIFVKQLSFDSLGRVDKETSTATCSGKASSKTIKNTYQNGFPWQILDDANQKVLWQTNTLNERGQILTAAFGNGIAVTNNYDRYGYATQIKHDLTIPAVVNVMTLDTYFEIKRGNLNSRTNSLFNRTETFKYDALDRLTEFTNGQGNQETQAYDDKGRITQNGVGSYEYDGVKPYRNKAIAPTPEALTYYQTYHKQTVSYNTFKAPVQIEETGVDKMSFTYNDGNDRSTMFYGGVQDDKLQRPKRKHYAADGSMEIKQNMVTGEMEFVTYIGGDGYSAPVVLKSDGTTQKYLYLHRDYQGTIIAITNEAGALVEKRLFDAWGAIVKVQDGAGNLLNGLTILERGYTGHEHLQSVGIIHMNGRLYDPKLHRFLQPDNFVQQPENTQNYNKYGYCLNNPLKYTDPSGEIIPLLAAVIIGAAVSAVTYTITALLADVPFSVGGLAQATFIGAASAAVTFGIGDAAGSLFTNFYSQAAFQAVAHGTFQGGMTAISGGKFWSGFAAGALSSIVSSAWSADFNGSKEGLGWAGSVRESGAGMIAFGTVTGGAAAKLTGGNFWQGAVTGLFVSALNHAMHSMDSPDDNGYDEKGKQVNNKGGDTTDYLYDSKGNIIESTDVKFIGAISQGKFRELGGFRGYGFKGYSMATGAINESCDPIFDFYVGGKVLSLVGEGFNAVKMPFFRATGNFIREYVPRLGANRYLRIGTSTSRGREVFRITWGNNSKHLLDIDLGKIPKIK